MCGAGRKGGGGGGRNGTLPHNSEAGFAYDVPL